VEADIIIHNEDGESIFKSIEAAVSANAVKANTQVKAVNAVMILL
jgi:hypothetical protein